ncbi:MAG: DMT family transporter [Burkholderiales bacterium]|nr:DMT family transporter [Burkholderiales bacterium]
MNTAAASIVPPAPRVPGGVFLALAMVTVGSTVVASRVIAAGLPPFTAAALRFAIALPVFLVLMRWRGHGLPRPGLHDAGLLALQALCGSVGYAVLLVAGLRSTSAADAGVITGCLPAVGALVGLLLLRERPGARLVAAIALACAGVVAVVVAPGGDRGRHDLAGDALVLAAVACEALFLLLNKRLRVPVAPLAQSTLMCGLGLAMTVVPALFEQAWARPADHAALLSVVYYAVVPTIGGYLLWYAGAARVSAGVASLYTAVLPVSALVLAAVVLHEPIGAGQLLGAVCVLAAIAVARPRGGSRPPAAERPPR